MLKTVFHLSNEKKRMVLKELMEKLKPLRS